MKKTLVLSFLFSFLLLANLVLAQYGQWTDASYIVTEVLGLPEEWLTSPKIIYNIILPFLAIVAVSLGFLRELRIFRRSPNIEIILAVCMAIATLPTHAFVWFVSASLAWMGAGAYVVFLGLFVVGSGFYLFIRYRGWSGEAGVAKAYVTAVENLDQQLQDIADRKQDIYNAIGAGTMNATAGHNEITKLDKQEAELLARLKTIKRTY
jgi:uncharacterized protein (UPF0335 family)